MDFLTSIIYGIIQGLTEFLPVSSSAHLALLPKVMEFKDPGLVFDLAMHVGTALAVAIYFKKDVIDILKGVFSFVLKRESFMAHRCQGLNVFIATGVTFVAIFLIKDLAESYGRSSHLIATNLILFGVILYVCDKFFTQDEQIDFNKNLEIKRSICVGLFQALAVFPGVSRSGGTLSIARFLRVSRVEGARFSFLLSLPIIFAGFFYKLLKTPPGGLDFDIGLCIIGIGTSFFIGILTIHFFLKIIARFGLGLFAIYRVILGVLVYKYL